MPPHAPAPRFTSRTLPFLRALKRNNDREWFKARKAIYEEHVRGPMTAVVERLALDLPHFAPEIIAVPRVSLFRPYRDTRFSSDKKPLKTEVAAVFPWRGLAKNEGAALYVGLSVERLFIGGGLYAPQPQELRRVREHIAQHHVQFRALVESPQFLRGFGGLTGERLQRVPRGFLGDHPAAEFLKMRQFLGGREYEPAFATTPRFYPTLRRLFEQLAPLIRFLNEPLLAPSAKSDPLMTPFKVSTADFADLRR